MADDDDDARMALIKAAMMEELGVARLDEFPMEDQPKMTRRGEHVGGTRQKPRQPLPQRQRAMDTSLAAEWQLALTDGTFDDDDAQAVKGLDKLGNGRLHAASREPYSAFNRGLSNPFRPISSQKGQYPPSLKPPKGPSPDWLPGDKIVTLEELGYVFPDNPDDPIYIPEGFSGHNPEVYPHLASKNKTITKAKADASVAVDVVSTSSKHKTTDTSANPPSQMPSDAVVAVPLPEPDNIKFRAKISTLSEKAKKEQGVAFLCGVLTSDVGRFIVHVDNRIYCQWPVKAWAHHFGQSSTVMMRFRNPNKSLRTYCFIFESQAVVGDFLRAFRNLQSEARDAEESQAILNPTSVPAAAQSGDIAMTQIQHSSASLPSSSKGFVATTGQEKNQNAPSLLTPSGIPHQRPPPTGLSLLDAANAEIEGSSSAVLLPERITVSPPGKGTGKDRTEKAVTQTIDESISTAEAKSREVEVSSKASPHNNAGALATTEANLETISDTLVVAAPQDSRVHPISDAPADVHNSDTLRRAYEKIQAILLVDLGFKKEAVSLEKIARVIASGYLQTFDKKYASYSENEKNKAEYSLVQEIFAPEKRYMKYGITDLIIMKTRAIEPPQWLRYTTPCSLFPGPSAVKSCQEFTTAAPVTMPQEFLQPHGMGNHTTSTERHDIPKINNNLAWLKENSKPEVVYSQAGQPGGQGPVNPDDAYTPSTASMQSEIIQEGRKAGHKQAEDVRSSGSNNTRAVGGVAPKAHQQMRGLKQSRWAEPESNASITETPRPIGDA